MLSFQKKWLLTAIILAASYHQSQSASTNASSTAERPQLLVIKEDIIPDVENTTQKVIRVNPLDLPAKDDTTADIAESSLYKIQSLMPATQRRRTYVNSNRMRRPQIRDVAVPEEASVLQILNPVVDKILKPKHYPKKKHPHFVYKEPEIDGDLLAKQVKVQQTPGAYPIYYVVAKTNGKFGKFPIKNFRNLAEFRKYLIKSKQEPISLSERYEYSS